MKAWSEKIEVPGVMDLIEVEAVARLGAFRAEAAGFAALDVALGEGPAAHGFWLGDLGSELSDTHGDGWGIIHSASLRPMQP